MHKAVQFRGAQQSDAVPDFRLAISLILSCWTLGRSVKVYPARAVKRELHSYLQTQLVGVVVQLANY